MGTFWKVIPSHFLPFFSLPVHDPKLPAPAPVVCSYKYILSVTSSSFQLRPSARLCSGEGTSQSKLLHTDSSFPNDVGLENVDDTAVKKFHQTWYVGTVRLLFFRALFFFFSLFFFSISSISSLGVSFLPRASFNPSMYTRESMHLSTWSSGRR